MIEIQKHEGTLRVRTIGETNVQFLGSTRRFNHDVWMNIKWFFDKSNSMMFWVFDRISFDMIYTPNHSDETHIRFIKYERGSVPIVVKYDKPVLIGQHLNRRTAYLMNHQGRSLAGSNTWPEGKFCLGSNLDDPIGYFVPDSILYGVPNQDLEWHGDSLVGQKINNEFIISTWPSVRQIVNLPQEIVEESRP